jgi:hypothetical protein
MLPVGISITHCLSVLGQQVAHDLLDIDLIVYDEATGLTHARLRRAAPRGGAAGALARSR